MANNFINPPKILILLFTSCFCIVLHAQTTIHSADFETGLDGWTQSSSDDIDWTRNLLTTPSSNTGPSSAASNNYYLYTEASSNSNNTAILESPSFTLNGSSPLFTFYYHMYGADMGSLYVEISTDGGVTYPTTLWSNTGQVQTSSLDSWLPANIDLSTYSGQTIKIRFRGVVGNGYRSDMAIDNISLTLYPYTSQEINITGNSINIASGDISPSPLDDTDYGTTNVGVPVSHTFTISNLGPATLNLTGTPIVSGTGSSDFSITQPSASSIISGGADLTFTVTFTPSAIGTAQFDISIPSNDTDESIYTFSILANAEQNFFESDGDGVFDNVDIDDDNDGIKDSDEELNCRKSSVAGVANYKYLNETFGAGTNRVQINTTYPATTTYCWEDGIYGSSCSSDIETNVNDGEYTVYNNAQDGTSWAPAQWWLGGDHTGDTNGRMAIFNATYDPGIFYTATIKGALPNVPITYSFWVLNLIRTDGTPGQLKPNIRVEFRDASNNVLTNTATGLPAVITTGDIPESITGDSSSWHQFTADLSLDVNEFYVYFINNNPGGMGNDLALDDIVISQTLCDTDSDGVADTFDLDSDNDGIPDVVESGNLDKIVGYDGSDKINLGFPDSNGNGMNDASETVSPIDSDGDGVPNYIDLDSDNDGIFDVDESGVVSTSAPAGTQNGDGDINGDGTGDGSDTDAYRETDINSDGILEYFTDGILDKYDYFDGSTFAGSYGNVSQGTGPLYVKDTDNDGIPDYIDVTSNGTTFDIAGTLYSNTNQTLAGLPVLDA
ncbi:MAG: choice-of-anchor D domain-containing protein, partial [Lutibacter sp.]|uniref:choice-of-anchor D domain-containing protein n=1 Tax=Lutibacter sp. TaxID=1925666 RepID=UPI00299E23D4